ncbi:vacuolar triacylglycerol lipase [Poronia punctata]|nr:vacuolar triacylglycerol lipase [Poronia punctata]
MKISGAARWLATLAVFPFSPYLAAAAPVSSLTVDTKCNKYTGVIDDGIVQFLGIRYAAPPVGHLRFMPPEDPSCSDGVQLANEHGKLCLATNADPGATDTSEDCLFLDIYAPSSAKPGSKLPVFFFLQGGGFNSLSNPNLNGRGLVKASGDNIIVVTFNYRVGPYGFITNGDEITPNNGLLDQRKALRWVNKYISHFGGDPGHVVLGGDSAGAASISLQMTAYGGRKETDLFHAGAAESVSFATVLTVREAQYQYDNFTLAAGCSSSDSKSKESSLACLRSKSAQQLQAANTGSAYPGAPYAPLYPWGPVVDGDLVPSVTYKAFASGAFIKIPLIVGDDTNEGTTFTPRDTSTQQESDDFLRAQFPYLTKSQLEKIADLYPNRNASSCPDEGCYWRQLSDAYGDLRYTCPGLYISSALALSGERRSYSYHFDVEDPDQVAEGLGVPHTVELNAIFGPENVPDPPASYRAGGVNEEVVGVVQGYWTSFIRSFDPNKYRARGSARWRVWDPVVKDRLLFKTGGKTRMEFVGGDMRKKCDYFYSIGEEIRQ